MKNFSHLKKKTQQTYFKRNFVVQRGSNSCAELNNLIYSQLQTGKVLVLSYRICSVAISGV